MGRSLSFSRMRRFLNLPVHHVHPYIYVSPENFLAYDGFDGTPNSHDRRMSWAPHEQDFVSGDPTWQGGKGKGIIGAINYLSNQGMNAFSFLTMNIDNNDDDDQNAFPYISDAAANRTRIDISKMAQWEIVFEHADKMGMFLDMKLFQTENAAIFDEGVGFGNERKLYYREIIARFSHHLALNWNIAMEEITNPTKWIMGYQYSDFFKKMDPYKHPVVAHSSIDSSSFLGLLLEHPNFDGPSLQTTDPITSVFANTLQWVQASASIGGH